MPRHPSVVKLKELFAAPGWPPFAPRKAQKRRNGQKNCHDYTSYRIAPEPASFHKIAKAVAHGYFETGAFRKAARTQV
jgi:hypothetical protein